jgi:4-amino-4-deoxy-L-arabinose transferase-like glycosyltransferase
VIRLLGESELLGESVASPHAIRTKLARATVRSADDLKMAGRNRPVNAPPVRTGGSICSWLVAGRIGHSVNRSANDSWGESFPPRLRRRLLLGLAGVTLVALCVRVPLLGTTYTASDTAYYLEQAKGLFDSGFTSNLRPPAYTGLLAVFELFGADPASAAVVFQNLIGIIFPAFVLLVGWRFFGPWTGIAAGFLTAASPLTSAVEQFALTDYLFSVVLFAAASLLAEAMLRLRRDRIPWRLLVAAGALFGLATLLRPNGLYALGAIPLALLLVGPRWKPALRSSAIAAAALVVVLAPWCVYNVVYFGELTIASEGGQSLYSRAVSYDGVRPAAKTEAGRIARAIYDTADPNKVEATVGTTILVYRALRSELGLSQGEAMSELNAIAREAVFDHPGTYARNSLGLLGRYQGVYYPRTLTGQDQINLSTGYMTLLDLRHQPPPDSSWSRIPWRFAQGLTQLLFLLTAGGLLFLSLPFIGDRRSRVAATAFLTVGLLGIVVVVLTARFELRHAVVFAPFIWILAPATVVGLIKLAAAQVRRPRVRWRNATT